MLVKIGIFNRLNGDISLFEEGVQFKYIENKKKERKLLETNEIVKLITFSFSTFSQIVLFFISIIALKISIFLFLIIVLYIFIKYYLSKTIIINTSTNNFLVTFNNYNESINFKTVFCEKWKHKCSLFRKKPKKRND